MKFNLLKFDSCSLLVTKSLLGASVAGLLLLVNLSAKADVRGPSPNRDTSSAVQNQALVQDFNNFFSTIRNYIQKLKTQFGQNWGELSEPVQAAIERATGELGIPDPFEAGQQIQVVVGEHSAELVKIPPQLQGHNARHEWNQQYTQAQSESTLGKEGQTAVKKTNQSVQNAVGDTASLASTAQQERITQNVMKKIAIQNAQQAIISHSIQAEVQKQTQALATSNLNLADMSESMNEQQRRQQFEEQTQVRQVLSSAAFSDGFWVKRERR